MTRRGTSFRVTAGNNPHDRAVSGSIAMHAQYTKGNETAAQITAQESNLVYANAARLARGSVTNISKIAKGHHIHHGAIKLPTTGHYKTSTSRGRSYGMRFQDGAYLAGLRPIPRGDRLVSYVATRSPKPKKARKVTGIFPKFIADVGIGHFDSRTSWGRARKSSGFTKIVTPRKKRLAHQKNWVHRGKFWIPK